MPECACIDDQKMSRHSLILHRFRLWRGIIEAMPLFEIHIFPPRFVSFCNKRKANRNRPGLIHFQMKSFPSRLFGFYILSRFH